MKKFATLIGLLVTAMVVTACGGPATTAQPPAAQPPAATPTPAQPPADAAAPADALLNNGEPATISFAWWGGDSRHNAVKAALDIFMDRYPHITVEPIYGAFGGYLDNLVIQLAGQVEPDLIQVNYAWVHALGGGQNVFLDLNTMSHIVNLNEWTQELRDFTTTVDGQLAGVPHGVTGRVIIYNRLMLQEHGFATFPDNFEDLMRLGALVAEGNATIDAGDNTYAFFPLGPESLDIVMLTMLYNETGRNLQANGQMLHTVDEVEAVFSIFEQMIETGTIPTWEQQEYPHNQTNPVWMEGRSGAAFEWVGNIFLAGNHFLEGDLDNLGVALFPAMTPGGSQAAMQRPSLVHVVSQNSSHPEVAAYLLNFLYTDEDALVALGNEFGIPLSNTASAISIRLGNTHGLQLEGHNLLVSNFGEMCPLFEDPNLRPQRFAAIEAFRTRSINARQAAERWVNDQQSELNAMN
ncbi:MAG: extracellular solute-binding protein [Defluviitaleaceae bacterium]|nr:extracellular solute-binding protein [Defluviitaleaceae bacterium]